MAKLRIGIALSQETRHSPEELLTLCEKSLCEASQAGVEYVLKPEASIDVGRAGLEGEFFSALEGIEDVETYNALKELGCDYGQGFYMARPMPAEKFGEWLSEQPL
ncbi:MAG: hypothetical protein ACI9GW_000920 [Halieaceae bacterium]